MIDTIKGYFEGWYAGVLDFFETLWSFVKTMYITIVEWYFTMIFHLLKWIWDTQLWPAVEQLAEFTTELPYNDMLAEMSFMDVSIGSFASHFIDVNTILLVASTCGYFLCLVALIKFTIKLVPGVG